MNKNLKQLADATDVLRKSVIDSHKVDHVLRKQLQIELLLYIAVQITLLVHKK